MKKKLSLFITLALATFVTTGCDALDNFFGKKEVTPTEQNEDQASEQKDEGDTKPEDGGEPEQIKVSGVVLDPSEAVLDVGDTYQIVATVLPRKVDQTVTYKSSDENICDVSDSGLVRALAGGKASINVTSEVDRSKSAVFNVDVNEREIPPVQQNYTVTFNANGGSGTMEPQTTTGSSYVVPACTFTYENHEFVEWALNSIYGVDYDPGQTINEIESNITLFAIWKENETTPPEPEEGEFNGYYNSIDENSSTLLADLRTLNLTKRTKTYGYSSLNSYFKYTDYDPDYVQYDENGQPYATKLLSFYSGISTTSYNKEHVWPNSRGGGSKKGNSGAPYVEDDIYMPRPTISSENSDRGNSSFVEGMNHSSNGWDPVTAFADTIGVYDSIRGECARIIFYCMTVNANLRIVDDPNVDFAGVGGRVTIGKLSDLLRWNVLNPVNEREIRRQSGGQYLQGNRNAFVDHPEYACKIWGNTNEATKSACGGN